MLDRISSREKEADFSLTSECGTWARHFRGNVSQQQQRSAAEKNTLEKDNENVC